MPACSHPDLVGLSTALSNTSGEQLAWVCLSLEEILESCIHVYRIHNLNPFEHGEAATMRMKPATLPANACRPEGKLAG